MGQFDLDFTHISRIVSPDKRVPLLGNEHRLTRVAYDMFRMDNEPETLWKVQSDDDGNEFLVRTYNMPDDELSSKSDWTVAADSKKANLTVSYKGVSIHRLAAADYGVSSGSDETDLLAIALRRKLSTDSSFVDKFLRSIPSVKLHAVIASFPELEPRSEVKSGSSPGYDIKSDEQFIEGGSSKNSPDLGDGRWTTFSDDGDVIIANRGCEVVRLAGSDFGVDGSDELEFFRQLVQGKLDTKDEDFLRSAIINQVYRVAEDNPESEVAKRQERPTVEVPIVSYSPMIDEHTRPTAEYAILTPELLESKRRKFMASPDFDEAFRIWLEDEEGEETTVPTLEPAFPASGREAE